MSARDLSIFWFALASIGCRSGFDEAASPDAAVDSASLPCVAGPQATIPGSWGGVAVSGKRASIG
jgi:hypothetical protein